MSSNFSLISFAETSNENVNFEQWEESYLNYIKDGGDVFEYEAGENEEEKENNNNKETALTRQQLVDQVHGLKSLANHSSNAGNTNARKPVVLILFEPSVMDYYVYRTRTSPIDGAIISTDFRY